MLRVPRWNAEYSSVNAPWTYFFSPAGPERSVVSSNPATSVAAISARISRTGSAARPAALRRQELAQSRPDHARNHARPAARQPNRDLNE